MEGIAVEVFDEGGVWVLGGLSGGLGDKGL